MFRKLFKDYCSRS